MCPKVGQDDLCSPLDGVIADLALLSFDQGCASFDCVQLRGMERLVFVRELAQLLREQLDQGSICKAFSFFVG